MSAVVTRRRALLGSAAAAIGIGVPATIASPAEAATAASPEAAALLREFHDVAGRFNAAGERLDKVITATARVPEPEALFARGQDFWTLGCIPARRHWMGQRYTYGEDKLIAELRALPDGDGDRGRADRRDELVNAWDRWHADKNAAKDASGETAALAEYDAVGDEHDAFVLRLVYLKTANPDVMKIKAALCLNAWRDVERFDNAVRRVAEDSEDIEDALSISLMRDLMAQLGGAHRVTA